MQIWMMVKSSYKSYNMTETRTHLQQRSIEHLNKNDSKMMVLKKGQKMFFEADNAMVKLTFDMDG